MTLTKYNRRTKNQGAIEAEWIIDKHGNVSVKENGEVVTQICFTSLYDALSDKAYDIHDLDSPAIKRRAKALIAARALHPVLCQI